MSENQQGTSYITVAREAEASLVIEKSRFIAHVFPVGSKEAAEAKIAAVKEEYRDATHNVPSYVIGKSQDTMWSSEDGEPQGTAGAPVLKMLVQEGLTDICIVTTRYFGGIKLGTGGLVRAYTEVAKLALEKAGRAEVRDMISIDACCDYKTFNKIKSFDFGGRARVTSPEYMDEVRFKIIVDPASEAEISGLLSDISAGGVRLLDKIITQDKIMC